MSEKNTYYTKNKRFRSFIKKIKSLGGRIRMKQALDLGISRYNLYAMRDEGVLEEVSRGLFQVPNFLDESNPDLTTVASKYPKCVVCLISALSFHNITTQIPHTVSVAIKQKSRIPKLDYPPLEVYLFSPKSYVRGIETHTIDGTKVKIYDVEKTLVDCFKFRNKIGIDIFLEALKLCKTRKKINIEKLIQYAKICRVETLIHPYLEAIL